MAQEAEIRMQQELKRQEYEIRLKEADNEAKRLQLEILIAKNRQ